MTSVSRWTWQQWTFEVLQLSVEEVQEQPNEEVASCGLAEPTHDAKDEAADSAEAPSACRGELKTIDQEGIGVHAVAGHRSAHQAAFAQDQKVAP